MDVKLRSRIDELIEESGLRREKVARELGVKTHQLKKIAKGQSWADPPKMYVLARLLDVEITELYDVEWRN
jgi:ribosome-binding protein aMBF1 (putative translation factor)